MKRIARFGIDRSTGQPSAARPAMTRQPQTCRPQNGRYASERFIGIGHIRFSYQLERFDRMPSSAGAGEPVSE
jgi:hypothetical protein